MRRPTVSRRLTMACLTLLLAVAKASAADLTVRIKTATPHALTLEDLANIFIVSKKATTGPSTDDMNAGIEMVRAPLQILIEK